MYIFFLLVLREYDKEDNYHKGKHGKPENKCRLFYLAKHAKKQQPEAEFCSKFCKKTIIFLAIENIV